jgi:hypothetical protein
MEMTTVVTTAAWYVPRPTAPTGFPLQGSSVPAAGRDASRLGKRRGNGLRPATALERDSVPEALLV